MAKRDRDAGRRRVIIEGVRPEVDCGRFPVKRTVGERVVVRVNVFTDGHDSITCLLRHRHGDGSEWRETPMQALVNDVWEAAFATTEAGRYQYTVCAWVDHFLSWRRDLSRREDPADIALALDTGAGLVGEAAERARGAERRELKQWAQRLTGDAEALATRQQLGLGEDLAALMARHPDRRFETIYPLELEVVVDRERARFSAWYELFPRSYGPAEGRHGTFRDLEKHLPYVASMGFDVLYLPPVHPIGRTRRKGRNNALTADAGDPGSPWAIGAGEGGHKSVHPDLGTLEDFRHLVDAAAGHGLEIALDIAFQCAPDHPYVREHPDWFRWRPDGTVQFAENPPKKYEDIYPFNFETEDWEALWEELKSVFLFWIGQGVRIFRVDNPHTKPLPFWEWLIAGVRESHPDTIFLAEAFTRPKVMHRLAKAGFTQSYTYFAWRNTKWELMEYFTELCHSESREYFRPNPWPNTPDILTEYLQHGGRPAFMTRLVLAATLSASYGIYGAAFELSENRPRSPGSEEYLDSEKYQLRRWQLDRPDSLKEFIARVNRIRRHNPALHFDWNLAFHPIDNEELICYGKRSGDGANSILVVVNLDPHHTQSGWVDLPLERMGIDPGRPFQVHDLLSGARYLWHGPRNYVELNPHICPAHVFQVQHELRTERDFDTFM